MEKKNPPNNLINLPSINGQVYSQLSSYRRAKLQEEYQQGMHREGSSTGKGQAKGPLMTASSTPFNLNKTAQISSHEGHNGGADWRGGFGSGLKQAQDVYSPLWLNSNLSLPRDRATMNAWCRSFYALQPFVQNAINLHSTYPVSKLNIKCPNKKAERFFNEMNEEMDLENICIQIAQEYWLLGEVFPYLELDEGQGKWSRIVLQNPDYIVVRRSVVASEPLIMMRPDDNLRKIVFSNKPSDIQQRSQLNSTIIEHIRRGENIPLDNFYISHLARRLSSYEVRGCSLLVSCFRSLMLLDQLRENKFVQAQDLINPITIVKIGSADYKPTPEDLEIWRHTFECHDEETEVLTDQGFKKFHEAIDYQEANGVISEVKPKAEIKIACFNPENEELEYHLPLAASLYNYTGDMYKYNTKKLDLCVTPNHDLWVSEKHRFTDEITGKRVRKNKGWKKVKAKDLNMTTWKRFRSVVKWQGEEPVSIKLLDKEVPIELYLKFLGYLVSEGNLSPSTKTKYQRHAIRICQSNLKYHKEIENCILEFCNMLNIHCSKYDQKGKNQLEGNFTTTWAINNKELYYHFKEQTQDKLGRTNAPFKQLPYWVKNLSPRLLNIFLLAACQGDGSFYQRKNKKDIGYRYASSSKQLADDIYEIVYKAGYVPITAINQPKDPKNYLQHCVYWSSMENGKYPWIYNSKNYPEKNPRFQITPYSGKVFCFQVPTGLFITRRNGKITIQGNSAASDKNFKIFTHEGVTVERVGANAGILDINPDVQQLLKEIMMGLMVPDVVMTGGGDITYANGGISLDVLRQRYMQFRNMMVNYLRKKVFAPISKMQDFYEYVDGKKQLIVPDVEWNRMSLFDTNDHVSNLMTLTGEDHRVSRHTLYHALGLEWEDEQRKIRQEDIQETIRKKQLMSLDRMSLNELRSLTDNEEIPEITEPVDQNESPYSSGGGAGGAAGGGDSSGGGGGLPGMSPGGLDLGLGGGGSSSGGPSLPPPPPPPPAPSSGPPTG